MKLIVIAAFFLTAACASADSSPSRSPNGINADALRELEQAARPFGRVDDLDVDRLQEFALKRAGFDLKTEMACVYSSDKKIDEDALGRVFFFSRQFNTLDKYARTYGQIIYSTLLNIGEVIGVPAYVKIIDRQP